MVHVHTPEHGSCGACPGADGCPMVYCPTCPTPLVCEQTEALNALGAHHGLTPAQVREGVTDFSFGRAETPTVQHPGLGRIVHVLVDPRFNNGSDVAPALITRVWPAREGEQARTVNLRVVLDGNNHAHEWATSRSLWASEDRARQEFAEAGPQPISLHAFWPPRT